VPAARKAGGCIVFAGSKVQGAIAFGTSLVVETLEVRDRFLRLMEIKNPKTGATTEVKMRNSRLFGESGTVKAGKPRRFSGKEFRRDGESLAARKADGKDNR